MASRLRPPDDITPHEFFTVWVPAAVESDAGRRSRLGATRASIAFVLEDAVDGVFTLCLTEGSVEGRRGGEADSDLLVRVDVEPWRALNRGDLSAPEAFLRRRVQLSGDLALAVELHLLLG